MTTTYLFFPIRAFALSLCLMSIGTGLSAQNWPQATKVVATNRGEYHQFGTATAISGDYAIVGAVGDNSDATGGNPKNGAGAAYIFKRNGSTWARESKIVASDRDPSDYFGGSVAISGDYAVVGAFAEEADATGGNVKSFAGAAYIFKRTGTTWTQEAKIVPSDRSGYDFFGKSVAISGDYIIVGAAQKLNATGTNPTFSSGAAYCFKRIGTTWTQEAKVVSTDRAFEEYFGESVAIDGDYAFVGAFQNTTDATLANAKTGAGAAFIFKRTGTAWAQEAKIVASDRGTQDYFGQNVAINGSYAVVGVSLEDEDAAGANTKSAAGSAYIFKRTGTTWAQEAKIVATDRAINAYFGSSVGISGDYIAVGANGEKQDTVGANTKSGAGAAYLFKRTGTTWTQEAKIVAADRADNAFFGAAIALSGTDGLVGASNEKNDVAGVNPFASAGAAYFYKRSGSTPVQETVTDNALLLKVYPSVTSDFLNLHQQQISALNAPIERIYITNLLGQVVFQQNNNLQSVLTIDVSALPSGVYVVKTRANTEGVKFVKN